MEYALKETSHKIILLLLQVMIKDNFKHTNILVGWSYMKVLTPFVEIYIRPLVDLDRHL